MRILRLLIRGFGLILDVIGIAGIPDDAQQWAAWLAGLDELGFRLGLFVIGSSLIAATFFLRNRPGSVSSLAPKQERGDGAGPQYQAGRDINIGTESGPLESARTDNLDDLQIVLEPVGTYGKAALLRVRNQGGPGTFVVNAEVVDIHDFGDPSRPTKSDSLREDLRPYKARWDQTSDIRTGHFDRNMRIDRGDFQLLRLMESNRSVYPGSVIGTVRILTAGSGGGILKEFSFASRGNRKKTQRSYAIRVQVVRTDPEPSRGYTPEWQTFEVEVNYDGKMRTRPESFKHPALETRTATSPVSNAEREELYKLRTLVGELHGTVMGTIPPFDQSELKFIDDRLHRVRSASKSLGHHDELRRTLWELEERESFIVDRSRPERSSGIRLVFGALEEEKSAHRRAEDAYQDFVSACNRLIATPPSPDTSDSSNH